jgi:hypothetical protein
VPEGKKRLILLIDDEEDILELTETYLTIEKRRTLVVKQFYFCINPAFQLFW